jgi:hypothetical protein
VKARSKFTLVLGTAALALVVGSLAWAAIPGGNGVINGCYDKGSGQLRVTDTATGQPKGCSTKETPLAWNQQGPQGLQGPKGDAGPSHSWVTDGGGLITATSNFGTTVATRSLPDGYYVISAKLIVGPPGLNVAPEIVRCRLAGSDDNGGNYDYAEATVSSDGAGPVNVATLSLQTVGLINGGNGAATVTCHAPQQAKASWVWITATQVGELD